MKAHNAQTTQKDLATLRKQIFLTGYAGGLAHFASAFSSLEILYALYIRNVLRYDTKQPEWEDRDRLILSKGHASLALYATLAMAGFFEEEELRTFCKPGTRLGGEANMCLIPGIEASTGSLGHGLSFGMGMALAHKLDKKDCRTYVILGDGECEEGSIWEAVMSASHFRLNNLTVILDNNRLQKMGYVNDTISIEDWPRRFSAFDWQVEEVDGHDVDALEQRLRTPPISEKPRAIIANTVKGKGVSIMENDPKWHFYMPNRKEQKTIIQELGITEEEFENAKSLLAQPF